MVCGTVYLRALVHLQGLVKFGQTLLDVWDVGVVQRPDQPTIFTRRLISV